MLSILPLTSSLTPAGECAAVVDALAARRTGGGVAPALSCNRRH
jgi:hypothetical protein